MERLVLPMTKPNVAFFPGHAHLFSVLLSDERTIPWIYNHYILLRGWAHRNIALPGSPVDCSIDFYDPFHWQACPWIYYQRISRELIRDGWRSIDDFVCDCLRNRCYVYLSCDMYYISASKHFHMRHFIHEPFVFGIDGETVYAADFFRGSYEYRTFPISEFCRGYETVAESEQKDTRDGVHLIALSTSRRCGLQPIRYDFNMRLMRHFVRDYLESANTTQVYHSMTQILDYRKVVPDEVYYGLGIYELLESQVRAWMDAKERLDHKPFVAILGHKVLMCDRIDFLEDTGRLRDAGRCKAGYLAVCREARLLLNMVLRHRIDAQEGRSDRIISKLRWIAYLDELASTCLYELLADS